MNWNAGWVAAGAAATFVGGFALAESTTPTGREPQFENADVKVRRTRVLPSDPLPFHRHEHARVLVALSGGTMKILADTRHSETHVWESGHACWLPANPPGTVHQDVDAGREPIDVMVVKRKGSK